MSDLDLKANPPRGRRLRIVLGVSLALNLLVIGLVAGAALNTRSYDGPSSRSERPGAEMSAIGIYGKALSKEDRRKVGQSLRGANPKGSRGLQQELTGLAREAVQILKAEPFDPASFADILERQHDLIRGRAASGRDALVTHISAMSTDERAAYAVELERALERGPKRWKKK